MLCPERGKVVFADESLRRFMHGACIQLLRDVPDPAAIKCGRCRSVQNTVKIGSFGCRKARMKIRRRFYCAPDDDGSGFEVIIYCLHHSCCVEPVRFQVEMGDLGQCMDTRIGPSRADYVRSFAREGFDRLLQRLLD